MSRKPNAKKLISALAHAHGEDFVKRELYPALASQYQPGGMPTQLAPHQIALAGIYPGYIDVHNHTIVRFTPRGVRVTSLRLSQAAHGQEGRE